MFAGPSDSLWLCDGHSPSHHGAWHHWVVGGEGVPGWGHVGSASPTGSCWPKETVLLRPVPPCSAPQVLLQEEPTDQLSTTVRQQAMLAIAAMRYLPQPPPSLASLVSRSPNGTGPRWGPSPVLSPRGRQTAGQGCQGVFRQRRVSVSWGAEVSPAARGSAQVSNSGVCLLLAGSEEHLSVPTAEWGYFCRRRGAASSAPASPAPSTCLRSTPRAPKLSSTPR